jgi:non-ribosomal peptide synthetase component F
MVGDQRIRFTSGDYRGHATFWKQRLSLVERASLLGAHSIASTGADAFRTASFALDAETKQMIDALTHGQALGRFVLGLAALFQTISRFTDSSIVAIKTPLYRAADQGERFADVVNLIEEVRDEQTLKEFASTLKQTVAKSYQYQNYPLEALLEPQELEPKTRNSILVFSPDLHDAPGDLTRYDLAIGLVANDAAISLAIHYNERLFDDAIIDSFATSCREALRAFKRPDALLKRVDLLGGEWRERLLEKPNRTQTAYPAERLIHELFEEQACKTPERIAVRFEDRRMTYAELDRQSDRLAAYLQQRFQPRPDELIGIMLGRSERMVVALLGILKAGAAYLPIDPEYRV